MKTDPIAQTYNLPLCLTTPIASKSIEAIEKYIGVVKPLENYSDKAFIVQLNNFEQPNDFDLWNHPRAELINYPTQLWVDVDFKYYKKAYEIAFPEFDISKGIYIDHIMNRKLARLFDFKYVRLVHVRHSTNTSSGRGPETLSVLGHDKIDEIRKIQENQVIQYADPFDLMKMLDFPTGGRPFLDVRDILSVFYEGELLEIFYRDRIINLLKDLYGLNAYNKPPRIRKVSQSQLIALKSKISEIEKEISRIRKNN